jgi:hypothetical protein
MIFAVEGPLARAHQETASGNSPHAHWIAPALPEKAAVTETAPNFFKKRAAKATGEGLMKYLRTAPRNAPEPEDRLR